MRKPTRRQALAGLGSAATVSLAGCSDILNTVAGGPNPRVTDTASDQSISGVLTGTYDIRVLVVNDGGAGDVRVTVTTYDSAGNTLDRFRKVVRMEEDESRRVDFSVSPSDGAERYDAEAEPA